MNFDITTFRDLNGHIGKDNREYERVHGGQGFEEKNELGDTILNFALAFDIVIANTCFKKKEEHLITYKSGTSKIVRKHYPLDCKDCKIILGESLST